MKLTFLKKTKIIGITIFTAVLSSAAFAYNPPVQGNNMFNFTNPMQMTSGFSVTGGPLFSVSPSRSLVNPALAAYENRFSLDLGYTGLINGDAVNPYSQSFGGGVLIPTKWFNFGGEFIGMFAPSYKMHLENSVNLKTFFAKEVADNFAIGIGVGGGYLWGNSNDWSLVLDAGAVYKWGELGVMKNFRIGASVLNLGKVYNHTYTAGIFGSNAANHWNSFPGFMMIKAGASAEFVNTDSFVLGLSLDVSTPLFTDLILDFGVQMKICDIFIISSGWEFDMAEVATGKNSWFPSIALTWQFGLDTSFTKNSKTKKSDMAIGAGWKNNYGNVNAVSCGIELNLGQKDRAAPSININANVEED